MTSKRGGRTGMAKQGYSEKKDNYDFLVLFNLGLWRILDAGGKEFAYFAARMEYGTMPTDFAEKLSLSRRGFATGLIFLAASPAIVRASSLMPVKRIIRPWTDKEWNDRFVVTGCSSYLYIRPRADVILTDEEKEQAAAYRRQLDSKLERQLAKADSGAETGSIELISHTRFKGYCAYLP